MRNPLVVLLMLLIAPQQTDAHLNRVGFEHLSVKQGLSNHYITCLLQDREDFMWLVSEMASINTMPPIHRLPTGSCRSNPSSPTCFTL